jgi:periplasmic copper chaperone A
MRHPAAALVAAIAVFAAPAAASAHISIHPNEVPAGAFATLDVRVPGEQQGTHVTQLDTLFPPGFVGVDYQPVPGWRVKVIESHLAHPLHEDGETIDSQVSQIVWTWTGPENRIEDGQFLELPLSLAVPAGDAGRTLQFKTVQRYSNGQVVRWIDDGLEEENPSPRIDVTAAGGLLSDQAGEEAGPTKNATTASGAQAPATATATRGSTASKGLALTALILGALGLLAGLCGLALGLRARRR